MKPADLVYQPIIRDEPLAYCLLVAKRMRYWQARCLKEMRYTQEMFCRDEAEHWEALARELRAMGHAVKWQRALQLGLPVDDETVLPAEVEHPAFPLAQTVSAEGGMTRGSASPAPAGT